MLDQTFHSISPAPLVVYSVLVKCSNNNDIMELYLHCQPLASPPVIITHHTFYLQTSHQPHLLRPNLSERLLIERSVLIGLSIGPSCNSIK